MSESTAADLFETLQAVLQPQYRLERELGRGGMGVVFQAVDLALDRRVAVKVAHPELAAQPSVAERFLTEARMLARIRHPNIVTVHNAGSVGGHLYYVMDEIPGESLRQRLNREGSLEPADVEQIMADIAAALDAASAAGFVHRDVKPENILLDAVSGRALLADFGIARASGEPGQVTRTGQGVAVGTPTYMSPEQAAGESVDTRSDVYSLGVVAYEALVGQPPFVGPRRVVVSKHIAERPMPIQRARSGVPAPLGAVIMRALEKHPADRWQGGEAMRRALAERRAPGRLSRPRIAIAAIGTLAVVGVLGLTRLRSEAPPAGIDPRHSILVLPFQNLRADRPMDWMRDGAVSMLGLNLSQWSDLTVVDHERVHDLLAHHAVKPGDAIGLELARQLAREAGVWTVLLGEYSRSGDSLYLSARVFDVATGKRVEIGRIEGRPGTDVRPMFDELAARLLDLSGAPADIRTGLAQATTSSVEAFRSYLNGVEQLNRWNLPAAQRDFERATSLDTTFSLAFYKLALARGWTVGEDDSIARYAIRRATAYVDRLPPHDRAMVNAYRAFDDRDYMTARALYNEMIARDNRDPDAWYGLGEAWFHDTAAAGAGPPQWTKALRAFRRTLAIDPGYTLAYSHVADLLAIAARERPPVVLVGEDSLAPALGPGFEPLVDSATMAAGTARARRELLQQTQTWVASQPTNKAAHAALVDAQIESGQPGRALAEVERYAITVGRYPDRPFVEAKIRFAAGEAERAAADLRHAVDSLSAADFLGEDASSTAWNIAAAANVFAYLGQVESAARLIELSHQVMQGGGAIVQSQEAALRHGQARWRMLGELYAATGAPAPSLRQIWQGAAEAARNAPPARRADVASSGGPAAIGLLAGPSADTTAISELAGLAGPQENREVRALLALSRHDTAAARRALADSTRPEGRGVRYTIYLRPLAAQAYYALADYSAALQALGNFGPAEFSRTVFDMRWGILARVRLVRATSQERLGNLSEARREYRLAASQWKLADAPLRPLLEQAERGAARVEASLARRTP